MKKYTLVVYKTQVPGVVRRLTMEDQNKIAGVPVGRRDLEWRAQNLWQLDCTNVHERILEGLRHDSSFELIEVEDVLDDDEPIESELGSIG